MSNKEGKALTKKADAWNRAYAKVIAKYWADPQFREKLEKNPGRVLSELGVFDKQSLQGKSVRLVKLNPDELLFVVPHEDAKLQDPTTFDAISGGCAGTVGTFACYASLGGCLGTGGTVGTYGCINFCGGGDGPDEPEEPKDPDDDEDTDTPEEDEPSDGGDTGGGIIR